MNYKRIDEPTPHGGDYSEKWYLNFAGDPVDETVADCFVIFERKNDGTIVGEHRGLIQKQ